MENKNGEWIMRGMSWDDPCRIRTWKELVNWIKEIGFLPFFANEVKGFSAEEHVSPDFWWTGDLEQDPWEWRKIIAERHEVAYGNGARLLLSAMRLPMGSFLARGQDSSVWNGCHIL